VAVAECARTCAEACVTNRIIVRESSGPSLRASIVRRKGATAANTRSVVAWNELDGANMHSDLFGNPVTTDDPSTVDAVTHNGWHLALYLIDRGDTAQALAL